jgi:trk system potassium uptake protein TrkA
MAKKIFGIKRAICTIQDPNNVAIFKEMGIDDPYSASDMLTEQIRGFSNLSGLDKNLALENGKIIIFEVVVKDTFAIAGKSVKDSKIPKECNITCIYKPQKNGSSEVIIPYGDTVIEKDETLVLACARENHAMIMAAIEKTK